MVVWLVLGRGNAAEEGPGVAAEGGGDGVEGGGVDAAEDTVELDFIDWAMCWGRRGMGSLGAVVGLFEANTGCEER